MNVTVVETLLFRTPMWLLWIGTFLALLVAYVVGSWIRNRRLPTTATSSA